MNSELIKFFSVQRQIFGVCTCCGDIFRLSDAKVYLKEKPQPDWMDKLHKSEERLDTQEEKINAPKTAKSVNFEITLTFILYRLQFYTAIN